MSPARTSCQGIALSTHILALLIFILIGVLLYGHTLQAPFYLDDFINIRDKLYLINSLSFSELINASLESFARRRPLANLSFALNRYFHGLSLPGYHLVNIVIHMVNGILLYVFLFKTLTLPGRRHACKHPVWTAAIAGLLWFANPVQIQSVTYIVQRMTSMATLFFLCSLLSYVYGRPAKKTRTRIALFGLSAMCWIPAMASKEIALTLPVLIFVYEWFFFQDLDKEWLKRSAIYVAAGFTVLLAAVYVVYNYSPLNLVAAISQPRQYTALERFLTQGRVIFLYISLLIYPHPSRLTLNHDVGVSHGLLDPLTTLLSFAGLAALLALTIVMAERHRIVAFCIIWFFANLAIEALAANIEPVFEHRAYLPSMLFFLPFVRIWFEGIKSPKRVFSVAAAFIAIFGFWTYQRNTLWNDPVAFWQDAVSKAPNHYRSHANLGVSYLDAKQYDRAMKAFQKALALTPPYPTEIYTNIGLLHLESGRQGLAR
ncbi:MAG: tetratricopeptide repeat protein, partial [Desulfobacterales bacterium]|nr:tetratricopeptide repeat protein [Desulfobacterales bacterium]